MQLCYRSPEDRRNANTACNANDKRAAYRSTQRKHGLQRKWQAWSRALPIENVTISIQTISDFHSHSNRYQCYLFTLMLPLQVLNQTPPEFDAFRGSHLHDAQWPSDHPIVNYDISITKNLVPVLVGRTQQMHYWRRISLFSSELTYVKTVVTLRLDQWPMVW
jgi:hypothetical protein